MALGTSGVPPGWQVSFSQSTVTLGSSQSSNNKETVTVDIFVPEDASAESDTVISFSVGRGGGTTPYDSKDLTVSVAPRHEVSTSMVSDQQTGRSDQIVKFPIVVLTMVISRYLQTSSLRSWRSDRMPIVLCGSRRSLTRWKLNKSNCTRPRTVFTSLSRRTSRG